MDNIVYETKGLLYNYLIDDFIDLNTYFRRQDIHQYASYFLKRLEQIAKETNDIELFAILEHTLYKNKNYIKMEQAYYKELANSTVKRIKDGTYGLLELLCEHPNIKLRLFTQSLDKLSNEDRRLIVDMIGNYNRVYGLNFTRIHDRAIRETKRSNIGNETIDITPEMNEEAIRILNEYNLPRNNRIIKEIYNRLYNGTFEVKNNKSR